MPSASAVHCQVCDRIFGECEKWWVNQNSLKHHMQIHEERSLPCPGCKKMYKYVADVSKHFESGYCRGCYGRHFARQKMYDFARNSQHMRQYLSHPPTLKYLGNIPDISPVPMFPYKCPNCYKKFHQQSQMYQHIQARHPDSEEVKIKMEEKPEVETFRAVLKKPQPFSDSNLEEMKLRTERFGTTSSSAMKEVLLSETKKRGRDRFGVVSSEEHDPKINKVTVSSNDLYEKMQKRKERFLDEKMMKRKKRFGEKNNFIKNLVLGD